jgi:hypothetical protein
MPFSRTRPVALGFAAAAAAHPMRVFEVEVVVHSLAVLSQ